MSALRFALLVLLSACAGCKSKGAGAADAALEASAAASATSATPSAIVDAGPPPTAVPTATAPVDENTSPTTGPFAGTYRCLNRLKLAQSGRNVSGFTTVGGVQHTIVCAAAGNACTGSEITRKGKGDRKTRRLTLTLRPNNSVVYVVEGAASLVCLRE